MEIANTLKQLFFPLQNCDEAIIQLCRLLDVPVTKTTIHKQLEEHPDYPSMAAIVDVLDNFGINTSEPYRCTGLNEQLINKLVLPFIAQIKIEEPYYTIVSSINQNKINFFHPAEKKYTTSTINDFDKIFTGVFVCVQKTKDAGEKDYTKHLREEKRTTLTKILSAAIIPLLTFTACIICFIKQGISSLIAIVYTTLTLIGAIVGTLLLWYEVDKHNTALQQICTGGKKTNCNAILSSDASKIFGISWSIIGFTYFAGTLISLLVSGIYNLPALNILAWLNVLALPYIAFSLYYQSNIAKQWCVLCLAVQAILTLQFITALFGKFHLLTPLRKVRSKDCKPLSVCILHLAFPI